MHFYVLGPRYALSQPALATDVQYVQGVALAAKSA